MYQPKHYMKINHKKQNKNKFEITMEEWRNNEKLTASPIIQHKLLKLYIKDIYFPFLIFYQPESVEVYQKYFSLTGVSWDLLSPVPICF